MDLDNRCVDESIFKVWLAAYGVEKSLKHRPLPSDPLPSDEIV